VPPIGDYLVVFAVAAVATFALTFPIRALAPRIGGVALPSEDRVHRRPTPNLGGAAMVIAFALTLLVSSRLGALGPIFNGSSEPIGIILAALVIYGVGFIDDVRRISPPAKVAGQVLAAMVLVFAGVTMYYFKFPFVSGILILSPSFLPLVTAIWVVGMANAINLIDGLDGLAAGIVAIASAAMCVYGLRLIDIGNLPSDNLGPLVAAITCGVCIGFLPHNFHPARVFMGDGGALFLGLVMAASTMVVGGRTESASGAVDVSGLSFFRFAPLFIPLFILGVPVLDTAFAIIRRTVHRTGVAERDLGHLHHRLVRLGHGHRRAVVVLWAWTAVLSAFALLPIFDGRANAYVPFGVLALVVGLYTWFRPGFRTADPGLVDQLFGRLRTLLVGERLPQTSEAPSSQGLSVHVSGSAGVAVAGEPDLTAPRRRRRHSRRALVRRSRFAPGTDRSPQPPDGPPNGDGGTRVAGSGNEMPG
jgi:UDP-GlcNAc:undecaprenyl-phosphate/decaprenyl-phosphate GlcNAc-1-phosphate transferase